jgi:hypothetical protein
MPTRGWAFPHQSRFRRHQDRNSSSTSGLQNLPLHQPQFQPVSLRRLRYRHHQLSRRRKYSLKRLLRITKSPEPRRCLGYPVGVGRSLRPPCNGRQSRRGRRRALPLRFTPTLRLYPSLRPFLLRLLVHDRGLLCCTAACRALHPGWALRFHPRLIAMHLRSYLRDVQRRLYHPRVSLWLHDRQTYLCLAHPNRECRG